MSLGTAILCGLAAIAALLNYLFFFFAVRSRLLLNSVFGVLEMSAMFLPPWFLPVASMDVLREQLHCHFRVNVRDINQKFKTEIYGQSVLPSTNACM